MRHDTQCVTFRGRVTPTGEFRKWAKVALSIYKRDPSPTAERELLDNLVTYAGEERRQAMRSLSRMAGVLLVCALVLSACQNNSAPQPFVESITYQWEPRAGLCFAGLNSNASSSALVTSITHVPATACGKGEVGR